jgi:hypothetical protein
VVTVLVKERVSIGTHALPSFPLSTYGCVLTALTVSLGAAVNHATRLVGEYVACHGPAPAWILAPYWQVRTAVRRVGE